jgi:DNA-binding MarR family transcriptional regulator
MFEEKLSYAKRLPGADCEFMPDYLNEYSDDPWDIRISLDAAPLDEAFYMTIDEPGADRKSIRELIEKFALNPNLADKLAVEDFPELPFIQEELMQMYQAHQKRKLKLEVYVNNSSAPGPVELYESAHSYMGTCTYHDHSYDYKVLDLVFRAIPSEIDSWAKTNILREFGGVYLLQLIDFFIKAGDTKFDQFCNHQSLKQYIEGGTQSDYDFSSIIRSLDSKGFIKRERNPESSNTTSGYRLVLTDKGREELKNFEAEANNIFNEYECYASISISPPALGVPEGFDARVQMMEYDRIKFKRPILNCVLIQQRGELFTIDSWYDNLMSCSFYESVHLALSYQTHFTVEILKDLKALAVKPNEKPDI